VLRLQRIEEDVGTEIGHVRALLQEAPYTVAGAPTSAAMRPHLPPRGFRIGVILDRGRVPF